LFNNIKYKGTKVYKATKKKWEGERRGYLSFFVGKSISLAGSPIYLAKALI